MNSACHAIKRNLHPRFLSYVASDDVASNIHQSLRRGGTGAAPSVEGRGLHSSTFQLNLSRF